MHYFAQKDLTCDTLSAKLTKNSSLLPQKSHRYERNDIPIEHESESQVAVAVRRCRISIFLNVWSSIPLPFFAYEPASGSLMHNIGTILHFTASSPTCSKTGSTNDETRFLQTMSGSESKLGSHDFIVLFSSTFLVVVRGSHKTIYS